MKRNAKTYLTFLISPAALFCGLIFLALSHTGCQSADPAPVVDTLPKTSSDFYEPPPLVEDPKEEKRKKRKSKKNRREKIASADNDQFRTTPPNRRSSRNSSADTQLSSDKPRTGNSPSDFVRAIQHRIVQMVYPDPCKLLKAAVLHSKDEGEAWTIELEIVWSDKWAAAPYSLKGTLSVGKDGSNARFSVNSKNAQAEALEVTYEQFKSTLELGQI